MYENCPIRYISHALELTDKQMESSTVKLTDILNVEMEGSTAKTIETPVTEKKREYEIAFRHHAKAGSDYLLLNFSEKTFIYRYKGTNNYNRHGSIDGDLYKGFCVTIDGKTYTYRYAKNEQGRGILIQVFDLFKILRMGNEYGMKSTFQKYHGDHSLSAPAGRSESDPGKRLPGHFLHLYYTSERCV